jgi:hypothetical protein
MDWYEQSLQEEASKAKLHSKVTLKPFGLKEQNFDFALKTKQNDVPIQLGPDRRKF